MKNDVQIWEELKKGQSQTIGENQKETEHIAKRRAEMQITFDGIEQIATDSLQYLNEKFEWETKYFKIKEVHKLFKEAKTERDAIIFVAIIGMLRNQDWKEIVWKLIKPKI